ncbi:MAG TPA: hypothetical protein VMX95_04605, partial [Thermodesulfobacteriota bacterium]|nr:hypothetical protein [Thermodesulfobacteriota bacterium]
CIWRCINILVIKHERRIYGLTPVSYRAHDSVLYFIIGRNGNEIMPRPVTYSLGGSSIIPECNLVACNGDNTAVTVNRRNKENVMDCKVRG